MTQKVSVFIQARVTSSRFPGKVLKEIGQLPSIVYQYNRALRSKLADNISVLIPNNKENDILEKTLIKYHIPYFRGDEENVAQRFIDAANFYGSDTIVRINGDCPLISASTIDTTISAFEKDKTIDYASTILDNSYPLGEHCECFYLHSLLQGLDEFKINKAYAEHVTPIFYNNQSIFKCKAVSYQKSIPDDLRLCIDYPEDYIFIKQVLSHLADKDNFELEDIIEIVNCHPDLISANSKYQKSKTYNFKIEEK